MQRIGTWGFSELLTAVIVVAALLGIAYVAVKAMGVPIPGWLWNIAGIVAVALVAIVAIRLVLSF